MNMGMQEAIGAAEAPSAMAVSSALMPSDYPTRSCARCGFSGCDLEILGCGCCLHARCTSLPDAPPLLTCPVCKQPSTGIQLIPMSFHEIDEARRQVAANPGKKKGRKRKESSKGGGCGADSDEKLSDPTERRTGRWTPEEVSYVDVITSKFTSGEFPVENKVKLNEFLGSILKSKQSRLTKKMKNASLSQKAFVRTSGYITNIQEARDFAAAEEKFFQAIQNPVERAEMKFHVQKEWRELFSSCCVNLGQTLDAEAWLNSVEEMDRRVSHSRDQARSARRRLMMSNALTLDGRNTAAGVYIDRLHTSGEPPMDTDDLVSFLTAGKPKTLKRRTRRPYDQSSPFLGKVVDYMQRNGVPFEHIDVWVPSFVPSNGAEDAGEAKCRLCFAGCVTTDIKCSEDGLAPPELLSEEDEVSLNGFGEYSQKFSFNVGCGLPGRVYENGIPTWEQSVQNAPHNHFERCGGAVQWGIKTVLGVPIPSPNVGRIVVVLYSLFDRPKDHNLVGSICDIFAKFMPEPKWKLIVDVGDEADNLINAAAQQQVAVGGTDGSANDGEDARIAEVVSLLGEHMPSDPSSPISQYLPGFMSLRLLLLQSGKNVANIDIIQTLLSSYSSYAASGRAKEDIALMLARDFLFLKQQSPQNNARQDSMKEVSLMVANHVNNQHPSNSAPIPGLIGASPLLAVHGLSGSMSNSLPSIQLPGPAPGISGGYSFSHGLTQMLDPSAGVDSVAGAGGQR